MELTGYRTLTALSQGSVSGPEGSIMKLAFGLPTQEAAALMMELQGACGVCIDPTASPLGERRRDIYLNVPAMRTAAAPITSSAISSVSARSGCRPMCAWTRTSEEVPRGRGKAGA